MESMRSLSSSLPRASRRRASRDLPPEDLLAAFKSAALSVTNLYKTAGSDRTRARAAGYQDALDDLLVFLDSRNLGLGDGEGWQVRQWATERLDGTTAGRSDHEMEEDEQAEEEKPRSLSPEITHNKAPSPEHRRTTTIQAAPQQEQTTSDTTTAPAQQAPSQNTSSQRQSTPPQASFTFRSQHQYPTNHDRERNMDTPDLPLQTEHSSPDPSTTPVRVEVLRVPRSRTNRSHNTRPTVANRTTLGPGAGAKRKTQFGDFFDLSGVNFDGSRESPERGPGGGGGGGGGKRGRMV